MLGPHHRNTTETDGGLQTCMCIADGKGGGHAASPVTDSFGAEEETQPA